MGYGLLDVANQTRQQALQGLGEADRLNEQREMMNNQMKEQARMQKKQNIGTSAAMGASLGMAAGASSAAMGATFGAAAGPIGMAAGAVVGGLFGSLF
ncbi:bacteriocin [Salmonella enterica]